MALVNNTLQQLENRRNRILSGGVNCIPSPFGRFINDFSGIEQSTYYVVTSFTKGGKCFAKGTQIRMADNSLKNVEDIQPGDWVLSPGKEPAKEVIGTNNGFAPLYKITSQMYEPFIVNGEHIMYLYDSFEKKYFTITMDELYHLYNTMRWDYFCRKYKMVASKAVSFNSEESLPVEAYFYGIWLGDGETHDTPISTPDKAIVEYLEDYAFRMGLEVSVNRKSTNCPSYRIHRKHINETSFKSLLKSICNWDKHHINKKYLNASTEDRYNLLAGIIDTDGYVNPNKSGYEICMQYESLIDDIVNLSRSLGLTCKKSRKYNKSYQKFYYVVSISGSECVHIPTRVKQISKISKVNRRHYTFKIEEIGLGEFYGFEVGGNHLFLLKDYTVVHNSQFVSYTFLYRTIIFSYFSKADIDFKIIYFNLEETKERILQRFMSWLLYRFSKGSIRISPKDLRSTTKAVDEKILDRLRQFDIQDILQYFEEHVIFPTEAPNPTGIYKFCKQYAEDHGNVTKRKVTIKDELGQPQEVEVFDSYEQDNPNEYRIILVDTINLIDTERGLRLKDSIDKLSEYEAKYLRNRYHYTIVNIQQQAFESESNESFKLGRVRPSAVGLGDSKYTSRDANVVLGLFSPFRFGITEYFGYDITILKDRIRFLEVITNRDGEMGGILPLWFDGAVCEFKELPKPDDKASMNKVYAECKRLDALTATPNNSKSILTLSINSFKRLFKYV